MARASTIDVRDVDFRRTKAGGRVLLLPGLPQSRTLEIYCGDAVAR
jgi:hypothetical protein